MEGGITSAALVTPNIPAYIVFGFFHDRVAIESADSRD